MLEDALKTCKRLGQLTLPDIARLGVVRQRIVGRQKVVHFCLVHASKAFRMQCY